MLPRPAATAAPGLGLPITKRLVELMGEDNGQSQPGQGSTFSFTLRLAKTAGALRATNRPGQPICGDSGS